MYISCRIGAGSDVTASRAGTRVAVILNVLSVRDINFLVSVDDSRNI